jgi:hypothetical protein
MQAINLSPANQALIIKRQTSSKIETNPRFQTTKNGAKLIMLGLSAAAGIAIAGITICRHKNIKKIQNETS